MTRCLILISVFLFGINLLYGQNDAESPILKDDIESHEYNISINIKDSDITGLCIMNIDNDEIVGTIINEFGVKFFDFKYTKGKVKIVNAFKRINKWYIKRVLSKDLGFFLSHMSYLKNIVDGKRELMLMPDNTIIIINKRYHIRYEFSHI